MGAPGFEYPHAIVIVAIKRLYFPISALPFTSFFIFFIYILVVVPVRYLFVDSLAGRNAVDLALKWDYYGFE